jgi:hypothetical protein
VILLFHRVCCVSNVSNACGDDDEEKFGCQNKARLKSPGPRLRLSGQHVEIRRRTDEWERMRVSECKDQRGVAGVGWGGWSAAGRRRRERRRARLGAGRVLRGAYGWLVATEEAEQSTE